MQCVALGILAAATAMLASSNDNGTGGGSNDIQDGFFIGFTACLLASLLSGIASALCQGALQGIGKSVGKTTSKGSAKKKKKGRNSFLYSAELALFSISAIFITSIVYDFNSGGGSGVVASLPMPFPPELGTWGLATLALNAFGGICVGQVRLRWHRPALFINVSFVCSLCLVLLFFDALLTHSFALFRFSLSAHLLCCPSVLHLSLSSPDAHRS